ncbi:MAG: hypothetical protein JSW39_06075 [Desulfobacterales bacterium]|nr:MAG: hypothetical protein JSW39_06075 [Desulfobacterales bacterium]
MTTDLPHDLQSAMAFHEKLVKLLQHWKKHNQDHATTYRNWAENAKANNMAEAAAALEEAADLTVSINAKFERALRLIKSR